MCLCEEVYFSEMNTCHKMLNELTLHASRLTGQGNKEENNIPNVYETAKDSKDRKTWKTDKARKAELHKDRV